AQATPATLPFDESELEIAPGGDVDVFVFDTDRAMRTIRLSFSNAVGDLDLYVYSKDGEEVAHSNSTLDTELVRRIFPAGTYYVKVLGFQGANGTYDPSTH